MICCVFFACMTSSEKMMEDSSGILDVLTYNIHALPSAITGDDTESRLAQLAPLLQSFDLIGIQEDWIDDFFPLLQVGSDAPFFDRFDAPLSEEKVYGSGLSYLGQVPIINRTHIYYETCFGHLENSSDCFASKGVQFLELDFAGESIHFYNTHLEAGNGEEDQAVRAQQIELILSQLEEHSLDVPVILVGDFNLEPEKEEDAVLLDRLKEEGNLFLTCTQVDCPEPNHIDQIYIRSGSLLQLETTQWERREEFFDSQGVPLSDHPAIMTRIAWSKSPAPEP